MVYFYTIRLHVYTIHLIAVGVRKIIYVFTESHHSNNSQFQLEVNEIGRNW